MVLATNLATRPGNKTLCLTGPPRRVLEGGRGGGAEGVTELVELAVVLHAALICTSANGRSGNLTGEPRLEFLTGDRCAAPDGFLADAAVLGVVTRTERRGRARFLPQDRTGLQFARASGLALRTRDRLRTSLPGSRALPRIG